MAGKNERVKPSDGGAEVRWSKYQEYQEPKAGQQRVNAFGCVFRTEDEPALLAGLEKLAGADIAKYMKAYYLIFTLRKSYVIICQLHLQKEN